MLHGCGWCLFSISMSTTCAVGAAAAAATLALPIMLDCCHFHLNIIAHTAASIPININTTQHNTHHHMFKHELEDEFKYLSTSIKSAT